MTISEIRRRINVLKRRFARELAIIRARRIAEAVAEEWIPAAPADPAEVIKRFVNAGFRLATFVRLRRYVDMIRERGEVPGAGVMVKKLLPWADTDRYDAFFRWDLPAIERPRIG